MTKRLIAVVAPVVRARDAVSIDAVEGARVLAAAGYQVRLFAADAMHSAEQIEPAKYAARFASRRDDVLLFHHSFGWPGVVGLLRATPATKLIKYHNVTPPEFFVGHSEAHVTACAAGRAQIADIVSSGIDGVIGDSAFNGRDYIDAGFDPACVRVAPPIAPTEDLLREPADLAILDQFCDGAINLLVVGRVAPNKNHALAVKALAVLRRDLGREARLLCVGKLDERLASHSGLLKRQVGQLDLDAHVHWLGEVSHTVLKAAYLAADVLLVPSLHEGFCVPIAEAMALGVPVVALDRAAVGETLGGAGVLLSEPDPLAFALAVDMLRGDHAARAAMVRAGRERFATHFASEVAARRLVEAVEALA